MKSHEPNNIPKTIYNLIQDYTIISYNCLRIILYYIGQISTRYMRIMGKCVKYCVEKLLTSFIVKAYLTRLKYYWQLPNNFNYPHPHYSAQLRATYLPIITNYKTLNGRYDAIKFQLFMFQN